MKTLPSQLIRATRSTFEDLGFMAATVELLEEQSGEALVHGAVVEFTGPVSGSLDVQVTRDLAATIATNMLGVDQTEDTEMHADALGEVANVICGNVVPALADPSAVFALMPPQAHNLEEVAQHDGSVDIELGVEEGRVRVILRLVDPTVEQPGE